MQPSRDQIVERLEQSILAGDPPPGERLSSERELAEAFSVSRPVVREVLRSLSERNLIEIVPGRGAFVRHAHSHDAVRPLEVLLRRRQVTPRHLVEARTMLECEAASLAAVRASAEDVDAMAGALSALARAGGMLERARHDVAFHLGVARGAHNPVIETMFGSIAGLTAELVLRSLSDASVAALSLPLHERILAAIRARDPDDARAAMLEHLSIAERTYGDDYDAPLDVVVERELGRLIAPEAILGDLGDAGFGPSDGRFEP